MKEQQDLSRISDWQMNALQWMEACYEATRERDEARRELCMVVAGKCGKSAFVSSDAVEEAKRRGWDCFKETP